MTTLLERIRKLLTKRLVQVSMGLLIVWFVTGFCLRLIWPIQPRMTIGKNGDLSIAGVSPDGRTLVTFTKRAHPGETEPSMIFSHPSGPIQIWDLKNGACRTICLPEQDCVEELVTDDDGSKLMLDARGWTAKCDRRSCKVDWFLMTVHENSDWNSCYQALVNLRTGELKTFEENAKPDVKLSPTGCWYIEMQRHALYGGTIVSISVLQTATAKEVLKFEGETTKDSICFSDDDRFFACASRNGDVTRIWNLETGENTRTIEKYLKSPAFGKSHQVIAGEIVQHVKGWAENVGIGVWELQSGNLLHRLAEPSAQSLRGQSRGTLDFTENDTWLINYNLFNGYEGGNVVHANMGLRFSWNLKSNEALFHQNGRPTIDRLDPNVSENYVIPASIPPLFMTGYIEGKTDRDFRRITTGEIVFKSSLEVASILMTKDGRIWAKREEQETALTKLISRLRDWGVQLPAFLASLDSGPQLKWSFVDVPSGRLRAQIPDQYDIFWLNKNETILVTTSTDPIPVINVWDFPLRPPLLKPFAWAALAPALILSFYFVLSCISNWTRFSKIKPTVF